MKIDGLSLLFEGAAACVVILGWEGGVGWGWGRNGGCLADDFFSGPEISSSSCKSYAKVCDSRLVVGIFLKGYESLAIQLLQNYLPK